jgi:hypothetical protein
MKVIATINSAIYSGLVKILSMLAQGKESIDIISIDKGELKDISEHGFVYANLKELFNENSIDILNPVYATKLMKLLKGGDQFHFLDDEENNRYHITNTIASISIPKAAEKRVYELPEIGEKLFEIELDNDTVATISEAQKMLEAEHVTLEIYDNKIIGLNINNDYEYKLDPNIQIEDKSQIKKFKIFDFMPLKAQEYIYQLYKKDNEYWIKIIMDLTLIEVEYMEKLTEIGEFDGFSLY